MAVLVRRTLQRARNPLEMVIRLSVASRTWAAIDADLIVQMKVLDYS
jgi:hypothetical protein